MVTAATVFTEHSMHCLCQQTIHNQKRKEVKHLFQVDLMTWVGFDFWCYICLISMSDLVSARCYQSTLKYVNFRMKVFKILITH